jgi:predicted DNA-binding transcriptional regulator AlpA
MSQIDQSAYNGIAVNRMARPRSTSEIVRVPYLSLATGKSGETIRRWVKLVWTPVPSKVGRDLTWPKNVIDDWAASGFPRISVTA